MTEIESSSSALRQEVIEALKLTQQRNYAEAAQALQQVIDAGIENPEEKAVIYSTLGLIFKKQGQVDEAAKAYQAAENCLPDDPVMKIIVARFHLNETRKYEQVTKRCKEILKLAQEVPSLKHQAYILAGQAYLHKGRTNKAEAMLDKAMEDRFIGMTSSDNIDFNLAEALIRADVAVEKCQQFLKAAYDLAREKKEYPAMTRFRQILDSFESTNVS